MTQNWPKRVTPQWSASSGGSLIGGMGSPTGPMKTGTQGSEGSDE